MLLVAIGLLAVLIVAVSLLRELGRTARSAERLCEILARDLPPTLEAIRLTGIEITELTDDMNAGVHHAGEVIRQIDQGLSTAAHQAQQMQVGSRSLWAGMKAAWRTWQAPPRRKRPRRLHSRHGEGGTAGRPAPRPAQSTLKPQTLAPAASLEKAVPASNPSPAPRPAPPKPPQGDPLPHRPDERVD